VSIASRARFASPVGLATGLVFWFASLTPTLVPRGWIVQGVLSGVCLAIGYGIGALAERSVRLVGRRPSRGVARRSALPAKADAAALAIAFIGMLAWAVWQDDSRDLVGMSHLTWWEGPPMVILSAVAGIVLVHIGTEAGSAVRTAHRGVRRGRAGRTALASTLAAVAVIGVIGAQVGVRGMAAAVNGVYWVLDEGTGPNVERPTLSSVSGSPSSLVGWETMGSWGRAFAAGATTRDQLVAFHGADARIHDPVRVFVGIRTAETIEERAAVAVRELERAHGFERGVLAVWVPAGSGWMDPNAARALELLHAGDTAIVATQYSALPSFFSLVIDSSQAIAAGKALFDAVHERWSALPAQHRPRLIVFGASLGAAGAEAPFVGRDASASATNFAERADGALIVGSLGWNPILRQLTTAREVGTPAWRPKYADGRTVRFLTGRGDVDLDAPWGPTHVLYLQHPSDPVAYLSLDALWSPLEWMNEPRGQGVPPDTDWFPVVSALQAIADISFAADLPSGYGHDYRVDYADAFAQVAPPDGWTAEDTARLETRLATDAGVAVDVP
jgi:uncharacterized membrane protein